MKDEEMAEEYAGNECKNCTYRCDKPNMFKRLGNKKECHAYFRSYEAFLAGLKAGRPQWHDLRKDPKDLPKLDKTDMSDYVITDKGVAYYNGRVKSWYIQNEYILSDDIIAWCEIPTFDKE